MKEIKEFANQFTEKPLPFIQSGNEYFSAKEELVKTALKIDSEYFSIGTFLGQTKSKRFQPSLALIDNLAKSSKKKAIVNDNAAWLFVCGRDIFEKAIKNSTIKSGLVLVQTTNDENLGYGLKTPSKGIKNILDKGKYLRS